ncbi:hypothetical protein D3C85_778750 [compost metagenome]
MAASEAYSYSRVFMLWSCTARTQSSTVCSGRVTATTGTVLMNSPTVWPTLGNCAGRPAVVAPNTTGTRPARDCNVNAQAAWIALLTVSRCERAAAASTAVRVPPSSIEWRRYSPTCPSAPRYPARRVGSSSLPSNARQ